MSPFDCLVFSVSFMVTCIFLPDEFACERVGWWTAASRVQESNAAAAMLAKLKLCYIQTQSVTSSCKFALKER